MASFFLELGEHFASGLLGGFFGGDSYGAAGFEVDESGGDFAPVAEFEGTLAEAAVGHERDGIGDAAVDLDVGDEPLALGDGVVNAEFAQAEHGEAHAKDLPGAQMAVGLCGEVEVFGKGFHG